MATQSERRSNSSPPVLRPLPTQAYAISRWKTAKVNIDYHVEFEAHYYSVPHRLVGARIEVRVNGNLLECFSSTVSGRFFRRTANVSTAD